MGFGGFSKLFLLASQKGRQFVSYIQLRFNWAFLTLTRGSTKFQFLEVFWGGN